MAASFSRDDLREAASPSSFELGERCVDAVANLRLRNGALHATVHGEEPFRVRLGIGPGGLDGLCTCPDADGGAFCPHLVAVGLAKLVGAGASTDIEGEDAATAELRGHLAQFEHRELVELLLDLAVEDEQVEAGLRAATLRRLLLPEKPPTEATVERHVYALLPPAGSPDHLTALDYAERIAELTDMTVEAQDAGLIAAAVWVAQYSVTRIEEVGLDVPDSAGELAEAVFDLAQSHAEACAELPNASDGLASWLVDRQLGTVFGECFVVADYADALGEAGIAAYGGLLHEHATNGWAADVARLSNDLATFRRTDS